MQHITFLTCKERLSLNSVGVKNVLYFPPVERHIQSQNGKSWVDKMR